MSLEHYKKDQHVIDWIQQLNLDSILLYYFKKHHEK